MITFQQVKQHVQDNKKIYIIGAAVVTVTAGVGIAVGFTLGSMNAASSDIITITGDYNIGKANKIVVEMVERSTPSKPIHLVGTSRYFSSINEAARETGHNVSMISKNVNGHIPKVGEDVFEFLQPAA